MNCIHCKDTGKYKQPNNKERFEKLIDVEMEKSYTCVQGSTSHNSQNVEATQVSLAGWMDKWMSGWMDGYMDEWMDGWIHG